MPEVSNKQQVQAAPFVPIASLQPLSAEEKLKRPGLIIQPKLTVGAHDDPLEHEADAVADQVMRMPEQSFIQRKCAHCDEEEKVNRKTLSQGITPVIQTKVENTSRVNDSVSSAIQSSRGGGSAMDSPTQSFMSNRFGSDFSNVKIHEGSKAVQLSRQLNAKAFTVGNDIYFNENQYSPGSFAGKQLLAHELTHVIQQGAVNETSGSPSLALRKTIQAGIIQRAPQKSFYGRFIDTGYVENATKTGVDIQIDFEPDDVLVDATTIGMVQNVRTMIGGTTQVLSPTHKLREVGAGAGEGTHIDQLAPLANPLFPTVQDVPGDTLASTGTTGAPPVGDGRHGFRFTDKAGVSQKQNAVMSDRPSIGGAGKSSGQFFETSAVAVAGNQVGTYYGSVSWGWERNAAGKFKKLDFERVSKDVPSYGFIRSAEKWNAATSLGTLKTSADPTPVFNNSFKKAFETPKDSVVTTNGTSIHNNVMFSISTITGTGKTGLIKMSHLTDQGDGRATIDLPIPVPIYSGPFDSIFDIMPLAQVDRNTRVKVLDGSDIMNALIQVQEGPHLNKRGYVESLGGIPFKNIDK